MKVFAFALLLSGFSLSAQPMQPELNVMPWPAHVEVHQGRFAITQEFAVSVPQNATARLQLAVNNFYRRVALRTGMVRITPGSQTTPVLTIAFEKAAPPIPQLGDDESYTIEVSSDGAKLSARTDTGAMRGLETFVQLIEADSQGWAVPLLVIHDQPRYQWRGLLLDVARHFMPEDTVLRTLDGMAAVKMNVLHWHLSDDQGFRVESKTYPRLHEMGSDHQYYTQDQIKHVIAYAADRGIRVMPEFDIPGHSGSWIVGYPEIAVNNGPFELGHHFGIYDPVMDPTKEETYKLLDGVIGEMAALFPDAYFHIGGDEVNGREWKASEQIQKFMREHNKKTPGQLQTYFNERILKIVTAHGKKMVGWDEILEPGLPKDIVVQSWRGPKSLAQATQEGYQAILSSGYYIDLMESAAKHYGVDPEQGPTANLTPQQQALILGGEATMWAEYVTPQNVEDRIWPRTAAIAERYWSPKSVTDLASMYRRLDAIDAELDRVGCLQHQQVEWGMERLAGSSNTEVVRTFAAAVEGVKGYKRERARGYTNLTPMNRMVDVAPPESAVARRFGEHVNAFVQSRSDADATQIRDWLLRWRDNDVQFQPMAQRSFLLAELAPISADLSRLAFIGLAALDAIQAKKPMPADWQKTALETLDGAEKPRAELLLVVVPHIRTLVQAVGK